MKGIFSNSKSKRLSKTEKDDIRNLTEKGNQIDPNFEVLYKAKVITSNPSDSSEKNEDFNENYHEYEDSVSENDIFPINFFK